MSPAGGMHICTYKTLDKQDKQILLLVIPKMILESAELGHTHQWAFSENGHL